MVAIEGKYDAQSQQESKRQKRTSPRRCNCSFRIVVPTCRDTLRLRNTPVSTVRAQLDRGYGHQGDFKVPVQHEAGGQRCSTWRPDCSTIVVQYDSTRADVVLLTSLRVAKGFAGGAFLALTPTFSCMASLHY